MSGRNMNVYFQEETYSKIKSLIAKREVSRFINEAVEEKLFQKAQKDKEELRKKLIAGYQRQAKNKKLQETLRVYGEMSWQDISTELALRENKNG
ncbi:MAG: hypothetical protein GBAus27B_000056 [Mycoplasmataceae bacterium]|nr:MAG: hypothetical protein GBAus27B_000056 [Mycoplasmataceae bacterium]